MKAVLTNASENRLSIDIFALRRHVVLSGSRESTKCVNLPRLAEALQTMAPTPGDYSPRLDERPWPKRHSHAILLLAISELWPNLLISPDEIPHHVTLAYALPLALDKSWRDWAASYSDVLVGGRQMVVVPASDLVAVEPSGDFAWHHRRLLRQHEKTSVREHTDYAGFLGHWVAFTKWRYGSSPSPAELSALGAILAMSKCTVREFTSSGEVIGRTVTCAHEPTRTLFDMMATWEPKHAGYRPGIFSAVHNLIDAATRGYRFSMCYGQFSYKDQILKGCPRLALEDLASSK